jgi:2Fe-2S ferredoxin
MDEESERDIRVEVIDREGNEHQSRFPAQGSLMEGLRDLNYDVAAICGGMCSCATCHVYIALEWTQRLPRKESDESDLLAGLEFRRGTSRLACQMSFSQQLDGLRLTLAPEE